MIGILASSRANAAHPGSARMAFSRALGAETQGGGAAPASVRERRPAIRHDGGAPR